MKKTRGLQVLQALNDIDEKMVDDAMPREYRRRSFVLSRRMTAGLLAVAAAVVLAIVLPQVNVNNNPSSDSGVLAPSGIVEYASLAEAESAAGFEISVPSEISGVSQSSWVVMGGDEVILQVGYGEDVTVRKALTPDDISGDYNSYVWDKTISGVRYAGDSSDQISLVTWTAGSCSYAISYGIPVSFAQAETDVPSIS